MYLNRDFKNFPVELLTVEPRHRMYLNYANKYAAGLDLSSRTKT